MNKFCTYLTFITAAYSFNAHASETTPLLKNSKQEIVAHDHLTELTLPLQLHILEYIAADSKDGLKTIKALAKSNKHFHTLCSNLDPLSNSRGPYLEMLLAQRLKITPKNAKKIVEIAQKNNDPITIQKAYKGMDYQSGCIDNCQDCCVCTLPWYKSPWEKEWDSACQENYTKRIKQKYGIASLNALDHENYQEYKESRKCYLGAGLCLLISCTRSLGQLICCPVSCCSFMIYHDYCQKTENEKQNFVNGKTMCGWLLWPCHNIFQCLDTAEKCICPQGGGSDYFSIDDI